MKLLIVCSALIASAFLLSCGPEKESKVVDENVARFDSLMKAFNNEQIVDVRTPEEFAEGYISGAVNCDWNDTSFANSIKGLNPFNPVLVYCRSGKRSSEAAEYFRKNGFSQVYELEGGITGWEAAGMSVVKPEPKVAGAVSLDDYNAAIAENDVVLVDFTATWCGPCKILAPSLHELETELSGKFILLTVDVDRDRPVAEFMNIQAMPTLVLYKKGQVQWRNEGVVPKEMVAEKINSAQ